MTPDNRSNVATPAPMLTHQEAARIVTPEHEKTVVEPSLKGKACTVPLPMILNGDPHFVDGDPHSSPPPAARSAFAPRVYCPLHPRTLKGLPIQDPDVSGRSMDLNFPIDAFVTPPEDRPLSPPPLKNFTKNPPPGVLEVTPLPFQEHAHQDFSEWAHNELAELLVRLLLDE